MRFVNTQHTIGAVVAVVSALSLRTVSATVSKIIGVDYCACTPHIYEFQLDFSLLCADMTKPVSPVTATAHQSNDGLDGHSCAIVGSGSENPAKNDLVPDTVRSVTFTELDRNLNVLIEERHENLSMQHGDRFTYESFSNSPEDIEGVEDLPRALQVNVDGVNRQGESVTNVVVITFSNDCTFFPVVQAQNTIGWMRVVSVVDPISQLCPAVTTPRANMVTASTDAHAESDTDVGMDANTVASSSTDTGTRKIAKSVNDNTELLLQQQQRLRQGSYDRYADESPVAAPTRDFRRQVQ